MFHTASLSQLPHVHANGGIVAVKKMLVAGLVLAGVTLGGGAAADAGVIFSDNFEGTTTVPGRPDSPQVGSYPTEASIDPESNVVLAGGSNPAAMDSSASFLAISGKQRNYGAATTSAALGQTVTFDVDVNVSTAGQSLTFSLVGDSGALSLDGFLLPIAIQVNAAGSVQYYSGGWNNSGLSHTLGTWEHYTVSYVVGDTTFSLSDGTTTVSSLNITNTASAPTEISHIALTGGASNTLGYFDNPELVIVPEPASLGLLAAGVLAVVSRKRRV